MDEGLEVPVLIGADSDTLFGGCSPAYGTVNAFAG
jgi:hypothetical protein